VGSVKHLHHGVASFVPVGLLAEVAFEEHQLTMPSGSTLLVYTGGVTEATKSFREEFGSWATC
jgi:serine phosphatase RsbU (regulator of sigma subunit)